MNSIMTSLRADLLAAGSAKWAAIAAAAGVAVTLPRKIAYADRANPRIGTIQPLLDYFVAVKAGKLQLPPDPPLGAGAPSSQEGAHA